MSGPAIELVRRIRNRAEPDPDTGCVLWQGAASREGYGRIRFGGRLHSPHRVILEHKLGRRMERDEDTCHLCHTPRCVNPDHLMAGSRSENMLQSVEAGRIAKKPREPRKRLYVPKPKATRQERLDGVRRWLAARRTAPEPRP